MAGNTTQLTSKELKEVQDFFKKRNIDVQIRFSPQRVRRIEDGSLIIDAPQFTTTFVRIVEKSNDKNGENNKLETV